jgi:hypothetical protein
VRLYNKRLRLVLGVVLLLVTILTAWGVYGSVVNRGMVGVEIQTVPNDAQVLLDGKQLSSSKPYINPGTYVFSATKDGFEKSAREITISAANHYVGLVLTPVSKDAQEWAIDNQAKYEEIGSRIVEERVNIVEKENPLLAKLPYIDVMGPFSVDFSFSSETSERAYIIIKNATPAGRIRALQWIRGQGVDPADLIIQFEDFNNPTAQGDY